MAVRRSIAKSLGTQYPPCRELPTEVRELLERLDVAESGAGTSNLIHCSKHGVSSKCHTQGRSEVEHVENEFGSEHWHPLRPNIVPSRQRARQRRFRLPATD